ncbi:coiled-coil domain-containing protein 105 [Xenopus laevis]|uniref:Uncharacterized protein n=2 Tax=Xenopus laevis TaxID=8355 RepID=A0A974H5Z4_XENLA|nr:coiled-coil domain-containing protein 105 [Xenopus laevis]OCT66153.1 hypothetical protein XELAEV_18042409mg [Xenopus laevis]
MAIPRVGSATWQNASYRTINWAHQLRQRPLTAACLTTNGQKYKQEEPLKREYVQTPPPFHRDLVAETSNVLARGYMRDTKHLMVHLRQVLGEIGRNIQRLQRMRHRLEHTHANIRRDILTNRETIQLRTIRPKKEMQPDKVDTLLKEEKTGLMDVKQGSEQQLQEISRQLQVLYHHRQILSEFCKEKSQVLEIVNETVSPCALGQATTGFNKLLSQRNADCLIEINNAIVTCEMLQKTLPQKWNKVMEIQGLKERVTRGLHIKADESLKIREDVILALGKTRNYIQKQQKLQNEIKTSYISQLGPVSTLDLSVRERLDRPLIKVLQRHPGTQVPESTLILKGTAVLEQAVEKSCRKIDFQELARSKLEEDAKSKLLGERIDKTAVRMRKRTTSGGRERLCF